MWDQDIRPGRSVARPIGTACDARTDRLSAAARVGTAAAAAAVDDSKVVDVTCVVDVVSAGSGLGGVATTVAGNVLHSTASGIEAAHLGLGSFGLSSGVLGNVVGVSKSVIC